MIKRQTKDSGLGGLISEATTHGVDYPTPVNFSYAYGFGFLALTCLVIQILTGIFLAMHYAAHVDLAFNSVEHVMRDVQSGQIIRYLHANGASMFFIVVYLHIFRGLYYSSYAYPRAHLQNSGVLIFLIMMGTGFLGYVLPQGQMSLQGATVITNLISAVPLVGDSIVYQVQGGFSVDNPTLNRIFSIHYTLPFVLAGLIGVHIILLHDKGSSNPLGGESVSYISFHPYLQVKDFVGFMALVTFMTFLVFFTPNALGHPDNYIPANPMVTPPHIVPEQYFLPFYAILRSIPHKLGGVLAMVGAIVIFMFLPYINSSELRSSAFRPQFKVVYQIFLANGFVLGQVGANPVEYPYEQIGLAATILYFSILLIVFPVLGFLERQMNRSLVI